MNSSSTMLPPAEADVVIVGAGLAGTLAAATLGRHCRVLLLDPRPACPAVFKAEKLEAPQAARMRDLGLLENLLPHAARIDEVCSAYGGRVFQRVAEEQYGLRYDTMVNAIGAHLPAGAERRIGRAVRITNGPDLQIVHLADGTAIRSRLVILACGFPAELGSSLGLRRTVLQRGQSMNFGFEMRPDASGTFAFQALTYHAKLGSAELVDYLTLFRFRDGMRANLFSFRQANDPWVRDFLHDPEPMLAQIFPGLASLIGSYNVCGRVEAAPVDLLRTDGDPIAGVALIGDAAQTACPTTGTGLSRILSDVHLLSTKYVPEWLATPGMAADKLGAFAADAEKRAADESSLRSAAYRRRLATERSLRWSLHRAKLGIVMRWRATRSRLRGAEASM